MRELHGSLAVPSTTHIYSICTQIINDWFLSKFSKDYFKTIYIEEKHIFDDYRKFNFSNVLKTKKPALAIIPRISFGYNRDMLDTNMVGLDRVIQTSNLNNSMIRNFDTHTFLAFDINQEEIKYTFKIRVESRAQQIDLYKYILMAFSVSHNHVLNKSIDFHIPYSAMLQLAVDNGFAINNNKIVDPNAFTKFINSISRYPITYKFRAINGKMEFFFRVDNIDVLIAPIETPSADDGEREGQLMNNFNIEMEISVKIPNIKYFMYYSPKPHDYISSTNNIDGNMIHFVTIELDKIPEKNTVGWNQYLTSEYHEKIDMSPFIIDLDGLFDGVDIQKVIDEHNKIDVSSNIFIDIRIYNDGKPLSYTMDWKTLKLVLTDIPTSEVSVIAVYIDTNYLYDKLNSIEELEKSRLK